jgi:hypothetical protein
MEADVFEEIFGDYEESEPCVIRRTGCKFTEKVLDYLLYEWEVDVLHYPHEIQDKIMDVLDITAGKDNVPNVAAKIAMEVLPL